MSFSRILTRMNSKIMKKQSSTKAILHHYEVYNWIIQWTKPHSQDYELHKINENTTRNLLSVLYTVKA